MELKVCCTSVSSDQRQKIQKWISEMGGTYCNNLMSDINILVVGDRDTDKYRFSVQKRHDITFVTPESVETMYTKWKRGDSSYKPQQMPTFHGLSVCFSRIAGFSHTKQQLAQIVSENGGNATDSLTTSSSFLVTTESKGKRYEKAREWKTAVVHPLWILDSIRRHATLSPEFYQIDLHNKLGQGACLVWDKLEQRKRRHEESLDDDEPMRMRKKGKSVAAWGDLIQNGSQKKKISGSKKPITVRSESSQQQRPVLESSGKLFNEKSFCISGFVEKQHKILDRFIVSHGGIVTTRQDTADYFLVPHEKHGVVNAPEDAKIVTEWFIERSLYYNKVKYDLWSKPMAVKPELEIDEKLKINISGFSGVELLHLEKLIRNTLSPIMEFDDKLTKKTDFLVLNVSLIGLNEENSVKLFKENHEHYRTLLRDVECNRISLQLIKNKLIFCQEHGIPIFALNFLFELLDVAELHSDFAKLQLGDLRWCVYMPKNLRNKNLVQFVNKHAVEQKKEWGKLKGKASESSVTRSNYDEAGGLDVDVSSDIGTQIGYR